MKTQEQMIQVRYTVNGNIVERDINYIRKHKNIENKIDWYVISQDFLNLSSEFIAEFGKYLYWDNIVFLRPYIDEKQIEATSKYLPWWNMERWLSKFYSDNYIQTIKEKYYNE